MDYLKKRANSRLWFLVAIIIFILILTLSVTVGAVRIPFTETAYIILSKIPGISEIIDIKYFPDSHHVIVWKFRLPRVLLSALVGAGLAVAGGAFQGFFRNPMADPYIIGISAGASLGAAAAMVFGFSILLGYLAVPLAAFLGALISVVTVYYLGRVGSRIYEHTLLLSGLALNAFFSSITSMIIVFHSKEAGRIVFWMLGGFSGSSWDDIKVSVPFILGGIILLLCFSRELNVMLFGEGTSRSLGVDTERVRKTILILGSLITSACVAVSGTIGFVGLIVPHIMRIILGPDHRILLPFCGVAGGVFMVLADTIARTVFAPAEMPVGVITALIGGPFFIYLLRKGRQRTFL